MLYSVFTHVSFFRMISIDNDTIYFVCLYVASIVQSVQQFNGFVMTLSGNDGAFCAINGIVKWFWDYSNDSWCFNMKVNSTWYNIIKKSCSMQGILMKFWIFHMFMHFFIYFFSKNNIVGNLEDVETRQIGGRKINDGNFCYPLKCVYMQLNIFTMETSFSLHSGALVWHTMWQNENSTISTMGENSFTMGKIVLKSLDLSSSTESKWKFASGMELFPTHLVW